MKYKRTKPNKHHWKRKRVSSDTLEPLHPLDIAVQRTEEMLKPIVSTLLSASASLDEMCAVDGHRFDDSLTYKGKLICATCGRFCDEC